ncbi:lysosomal alpha-mannosidase [Patella vulgata]|uniref:lysosomal alpha-mannosidase n=1 Tax=Patella vulgata TaxID=6465 RepID=UPI0024A9E84B|nr:lysosomal alpha-mannosidase [Patella vulgata]
MNNYFCIIALILYNVHGAPTDLFHSALKCGYGSCNPVKDGMINVHLVPHTHDDVGWLKTVDQYYYGDHNDIALAGVQYILDSVIPQLVSDPSKRFIYVEIAFFSRWWREQTDSMRHVVKGLVAEGRLEFILGGWSMDDEATTHYNAIIDQHTLGFDFLRQNFQDCGRPRVAWQIDPFGHSREQASLFAQMGFDGLFFGRLDYQDKANRLNKKTMEMIWKGSPKNLGQTSELFTGALFNQYGPPAGFCWDFDHCDSGPIMDDERLHDYNVPTVLADLFKAVSDQADHYQTKHIIWTMGSDFQYDNANVWYKNMDKLIKYANALQANGSTINLLYSTPSCYLDQLNKAGLKWTTKEDDFFPYSNDAHSVWTGFLTSRPTLKFYVRRTNNFLQVTKQMDALAMLEDTDNSTYNINILKEAMGVAQHHDAVSGTEKQPVAYDYATRLANGVNECQKVINDAYGKLMPLGSQKPPGHQFCTLLNISSCSVTENNKMFQLHIYNPIARPVEYYVKLPVVGKLYYVIGPDGIAIETQVLPISPDTMRIPERNGSLATNELIFPTTLQPLGFTTYFIQMGADEKTKQNHATKIKHLSKLGDGDDFVLENLFISLTFDIQTGRLKNIKNKRKNISVNMTQEFRYYYGFDGNDSKDELQPSNSYIFRPNGTQSYNCSTPSLTTKTYYTEPGELVQELHQTFSPWATQTIILYENARFAEFQWTVGPIPIDDKLGKEVISKFTTDLKNQGFYYTDANGREILERRRNHRDTWALNLSEPIAGNYYPINSRIFIQDQTANVQLTILNDRSQGGASIQDGEIEIMVHRRLLNTVSLGEALNETGSDGKGLVVRGSHYVYLDTIEASAALHREKAEELFMAPQMSFTTVKTNYSDWSKNFRTMWSGVKQALPPNVHLLTLEQFAGTGPVPSQSQPYLLRLEHMYETDEDATLSKPVNVSLQDLFTTFEITSATELTLGANLPLSQLQRLKWMSADDVDTEPTDDQDSYLKYQRLTLSDSLTITLNPMQIRTLQIEIKSRQQFLKK